MEKEESHARMHIISQNCNSNFFNVIPYPPLFRAWCYTEDKFVCLIYVIVHLLDLSKMILTKSSFLAKS
jgi:hypothetical protein